MKKNTRKIVNITLIIFICLMLALIIYLALTSNKSTISKTTDISEQPASPSSTSITEKDIIVATEENPSQEQTTADPNKKIEYGIIDEPTAPSPQVAQTADYKNEAPSSPKTNTTSATAVSASTPTTSSGAPVSKAQTVSTPPPTTIAAATTAIAQPSTKTAASSTVQTSPTPTTQTSAAEATAATVAAQTAAAAQITGSSAATAKPLTTENNKVEAIEQDKFIIARFIFAKDLSYDPNVPNSSKGEFIKVEFWESPINYRGYKLSKSSLLLFGIPDPNAVLLSKKDNSIILNIPPDKSFTLERSSDFVPVDFKNK